MACDQVAPFKNEHLAREFGHQLSATIRRIITLGQNVLDIGDVGQIDQVRVRTKLLEHADSDKRVLARLSDGSAHLRRLREKLVEVDLQRRWRTEDDMLVLDGD